MNLSSMNETSTCWSCPNWALSRDLKARSTCRQLLVALCLFLTPAYSLSARAQDRPSTLEIGGPSEVTDENTFGQDIDFLRRHVDTVVLKSASGRAQVAVVPAYQGRVMTSSANGTDGLSFGWINYTHVEADQLSPHINVYGGEERFWLGPEGGQFSIFFPSGSKFEFSDWQTPALIDTVPFRVVHRDEQNVVFRHDAKLTNYSGTNFELRVDRQVELISSARELGISDHHGSWVGYRTTNRLTNTGKEEWSKQAGLLSIWLLGMYKHGPETTVVIPFSKGSEEEMGPIVNDSYFGKVPQERLKVDDGVLFFSGDGKYRSKIGLTPQRSMGICGSYDAKRGVLTIVKYNQPGSEVTDYVNSMWEIQDEPYAGDAINAYNDGAPEPGGKPLGPFYELETSSPALALKSSESGVHVQETYHILGSKEYLDGIANRWLGASLQQIESALR